MRALSLLSFFFLLLPSLSAATAPGEKPLRIGVVGLTHTHVHWLLGREKRGDLEIVGIAEKNRDLARRYTQQHGLSMEIVFDTMEEMLDKTKPTAVTAFGSIYDHPAVVRIAAPRGVHVMVEKPLAVNLQHAREMAALAEKHGIFLMVNYETTWYPSVERAFELVWTDQVGPVRKVVVHDGHRGPKKIGVNQEFLDWLTDPVQNGGGALTDFGCYGVNLLTGLMQGARPTTVTAITQHLQPLDYPKVEDEATIILTYPATQAIIQASWNWPVSRKDMEIYGTRGYVLADNRHDIRVRLAKPEKATTQTLPELVYPHNDPFAYFKALIEGRIKPGKFDLSSVANNLLVMEILDAAAASAQQGKTIRLPPE